MKRKFEQIYRRRFRNGRHPGATDLRMFVCEWLYNRRSELASAIYMLGGEASTTYGYTYDTIGNRISATENSSTRAYTSNALNQYTSIASATRIGDRCLTPVANYGVLEDFGYGNVEHYGLKGPLGIMHSEDHLIHYMKQPRIWLSLDDKERMKCRGLVGKDVVVEGRLSLRGDESNVSHELESLSVNLAQCRILQDVSLGGASINNDPVCEFTSPCREFKIKVRMLDGKEYHVHCYSSTLWMARIEKDGQVYAQSPWSLYAVAHNGVQRSIWASLGRVEAVLADKYKEDSFRAGVCKAKPYSKIVDMNFTAADNQELASIFQELFDFLDQERRR